MKGSDQEDFYSSYIANCVLNFFLCYTAIVLNIITIHAIRKTSSLPKTLKTLLLSLAVSDLGVGLLVHPLYIVVLIMESKQNTDNLTYYYTYKAFLLTANVLGFTSFFGVIALGADRFLAIHFHLRYQELVTRKRVVAVVISFWVFSAFLSLIRQWIPTNIIYLIFVIIEVACVITATYFSCKIYVAIRSHTDQIQAMQVQQQQQQQQVAQDGEMTNVARLRKSAAVTVSLSLVFLVCYLPNICILFVTAVSGPSAVVKISSRYFMTLVFLNSSLNPPIYCWKMKHVRHAAMDILRNAFSSDNQEEL